MRTTLSLIARLLISNPLFTFVWPNLQQVEGQQSAWLSDATIEIALRETEVCVAATYTVDLPTPSITLYAPRIEGQVLRVEEATSDGDLVPVEGQGGAYRLRIRSQDVRRVVIFLHYCITGNLMRVPIFVPDAPAVPTQSQIQIRISGVPQPNDLGAGLPRLERMVDGEVRAQPVNLPSLVVLPPTPELLSVDRTAELTVILLVLMGSLAWARVMARARRRQERPKDTT